MQCALPNKESKGDKLDSIPVDLLAWFLEDQAPRYGLFLTQDAFLTRNFPLFLILKWTILKTKFSNNYNCLVIRVSRFVNCCVWYICWNAGDLRLASSIVNQAHSSCPLPWTRGDLLLPIISVLHPGVSTMLDEILDRSDERLSCGSVRKLKKLVVETMNFYLFTFFFIHLNSDG